MAFRIFKVRVLDWNTYNKSPKNGHKSCLVPNNICTDPRLNALPTSHRWLYIALFTACGDIGNDTVTVSERLVNDTLTSRVGAENALHALQSLQLVTFEISMSFINRIEKKGIERNRKERNTDEVEATVAGPPKTVPVIVEKIGDEKLSKWKQKKLDTIENAKIWDAYKEAHEKRYRVPVKDRDATLSAQVSNLRKRLGTDDAVDVVRFYVSHNDSFYLRSTHSFGICLKQCETLRTQMLRGKPITNTNIRQYEKQQDLQETLRRIDEEGI